MARREKQVGGGFALLIVAGLLLAILFAVVAAVAKAWPFLVLIALGVLVFDGATYGLARMRGQEPPMPKLRASRKLLTFAAWMPRTAWRWLRAVFGFPYVEPIRVQSIGELLMLTPREFEEAIAQGLRDRGYHRVERRGGPGDLGVDITCLDPNGESLAVQCKRYVPGNLVGSREIQLFIGMVTTEHRVERGVYVTTSGFTAPARQLAERHGIHLIDGAELARVFGIDGPPLPERLRPSTPVAGDADRLFYETDEAELVDWEWLSKRLALQGIKLPGDIVRPLDGSGRRGVRFMSTDDAHRAAALMEQEAELLDAQADAAADAALDAERSDHEASIAEAALAKRAETEADAADRRAASDAPEARGSEDARVPDRPRRRRATNEALLRLLREHEGG